jgi:Vps16, C-terminal region./Vps16, N-terminal region.
MDGRRNSSNNYEENNTLLQTYLPLDSLVGASWFWFLRDSLCLTYSLSGKAILPPFHVLNDTAKGSGTLELIEATIYDGGVAVLGANMSCALVEFLNSGEDDNDSYRINCHIAARIVRAMDWDEETSIGGGVEGRNPGMDGSTGDYDPLLDSNTATYYAIITPLATATHAKKDYISYTSIAVLPRVHTQSRHPEVFLGTSNNSVIICDTSSKGGIVDVQCQERIASPIVQMKFAPNGRFLACFTQNSMMTVISTNFETKVLDFDTSDGSSDLPHNMEWCGEDSVVLHWKNLGVLMVGPYGDWLRYPYSGSQNVHLCAEADCCRVISDSRVEILQRVPPATAAMLRIGSIEPSALLLDANDAFENGSPSSDEAARAITRSGMLMDAIEICIDAAAKEFDVAMQKRLLKAASYGMHFDYKDGNTTNILGGKTNAVNKSNVRPSEVALLFVEAAKKIRVLNALRHPSVGIAMTSAQYDSIESTGVIARLIAMKRPALATTLATYLQLDEAVRAYARASRAAAFVATDNSNSDSETTDAAIRILNTDAKNPLMNRGGYAMVALAANKAGRQGVANLLLTLESSISDKVPGLTAIGLYSDAATVASHAKDDNLIFHVLAEFEKSCILKNIDPSQAQVSYLSTVVRSFPPEAMNILSKYFETMHDVKHVVNLRNSARHYSISGTIIAKRALDAPREQDRLSLLQEASRLYAQDKDNIFLKACTDEYLELILEQERLRRAFGPDVTTKTSSVTDTIFNVLCYAAVKLRDSNKLIAESEKLAKKFKVPEKRLWHTKIRAFAATDQWKNMRQLAESRTKIPISFKYFALEAIKHKQDVSEVLWYIQRVTDGEERYDLFCEAKLWKRALDEAKRLEDTHRVMHIKSVCNSTEIQQMCDNFLHSYA